MKLLTYFILLTIISICIISCKKKGCTDPNALNYNENVQDDDGTCEYEFIGHPLTLNLNHVYDGISVPQTDLDVIKFTNQFGNLHSISKLVYLISDIRFYKDNGDSITTDGYNLIDLQNENSLTIDQNNIYLQEGSYSGIGFSFGFEEDDNISGAYTDLNSASWSWPMMLGGGYHFMKFEGKFIGTSNDTINFNYHMGTSREITAIDTTFHDNHVFVKINQPFDISNEATINLKFNIDEWFKNPNLWDLNIYNSMLMPNFAAQIMMKENGTTVFSWESIDQ